MLQNRAKGLASQLPRIPAELFEPNGNLIRSILERMSHNIFRGNEEPPAFARLRNV